MEGIGFEIVKVIAKVIVGLALLLAAIIVGITLLVINLTQ